MLLQAAIAQLEQGIEQVGDSFQTLDQQLGHIGQTATRIGDRLQVSPVAACPQLTACSCPGSGCLLHSALPLDTLAPACPRQLTAELGHCTDVQHLAVLQSAEGFRTRAQEAMKLLQDMQQFAAADTFDDLSDLYSDPARLAEAAVSSTAFNSCLPLFPARKGASLPWRGSQVDRPSPHNSIAFKLAPGCAGHDRADDVASPRGHQLQGAGGAG